MVWIVLDPIYSDDYETNFDQYGGGGGGGSGGNGGASILGGNGGTNGGSMGLGGETVKETSEDEVPPNLPPPPRVPPPPTVRAPPRNRTHARPCTKRTDLYILQPNRLNNSGSFNPLKGKLTNCHVTGCERSVALHYKLLNHIHIF